MGRKPMSLHAPLPKPDREKVERKVAYEKSKEEITKWEPLVKRNREAPTVYFDEDTDVWFSTVGAIASEFEPRSILKRKWHHWLIIMILLKPTKTMAPDFLN